MLRSPICRAEELFPLLNGDNCVALRVSELSLIWDINYVGVETDRLSHSAANQIFLQCQRPGPTPVKITSVHLWKNQAETVAASAPLAQPVARYRFCHKSASTHGFQSQTEQHRIEIKDEEIP